MLKRITTMFIVLGVLCSMAYTIGGAKAAGQSEAIGIPPQHPVVLALHFRTELGLSSEQIAKIEQLREAMAKEFAPLREQAEALQHQMQALQESGKQDEDAGKKLKQQGDELGTKIQPLFERYGNSVAELLSQDQKEKLMKLSDALAHGSKEAEFVLITAMDAREKLGITPAQFTKLQFLQ